MSFEALALTEGPLAAAYLLTLGAMAAGMIEVPKERRLVARNCFLASCLIFAGMAYMWGISTEFPVVPRVLVVGILCGLAGIAAVECSRFIMPHEKPVVGPALPLTDARPEVPNEFSGWTNTQLIERVKVVVSGMRQLDERYTRMEHETLGWHHTGPTEEDNTRGLTEGILKSQSLTTEKNTIFRNQFYVEARTLRAAMLLRTPELQPPPTGYDPFRLGKNVIDTGRLGGPYPISAAADYLEALSRTLR
jgi:hypothetical protein